MTSGNHIWDKKEALDYIGTEPRLLRPANYPAGVPGNGSYLARTRDGAAVGVINVMGRVFMLNIDDPFAVVLREIEALRQRTRIIFVDFHAEATSEKIAMGWHLDGKVTAVVGTHTHVQTADERILPKGTAYLTDVGMTGPHDSIIGVEIEAALGRFLNALPARFETATGNPAAERRDRRRRRRDRPRDDIERLSLSVDELAEIGVPICIGQLTAPSMSDLFDLPFEEDDEDEPPLAAEDRSARSTGRAGPDAARPAIEPGAGARRAAARRILTVTELTVRVRDLLEAEFFEVWVEGELSNCRVWNTGHLYFTLKDAGVADHAA